MLRRASTTRERAARTRAEDGWAEVVVLLLFAAVIGFAFLWALVLHEKPPEKDSASSTATSAGAPLTPAELPPPRQYKVSDGVNVRQGPATNTTVLLKIEDGMPVTVVCRIEGQEVTSSAGSTNLWLQITLESGPAYVSALYVDMGDDIEDVTKIGICPA